MTIGWTLRSGGAPDRQRRLEIAARKALLHRLAHRRLEAFEALRQPQPHLHALAVDRFDLPGDRRAVMVGGGPREAGHALQIHWFLRVPYAFSDPSPSLFRAKDNAGQASSLSRPGRRPIQRSALRHPAQALRRHRRRRPLPLLPLPPASSQPPASARRFRCALQASRQRRGRRSRRRRNTGRRSWRDWPRLRALPGPDWRSASAAGRRSV